jgi:hypothetical protein
MEVRGNWTYQLTFKPAALFRNTYIADYEGYFLNMIVISFYYERLNFQSAVFNDTKLADIVSEDFMSNYGIDHRFGFKIGFALYLEFLTGKALWGFSPQLRWLTMHLVGYLISFAGFATISVRNIS